MRNRRRPLLPFPACLAVLLVALSGWIAAQDPTSDGGPFTRDFGPSGDKPVGYRIRFDPVGGSVRSITLLDQSEPRESRHSPVAPYEIVPPEYANPAEHNNVYPALTLSSPDRELFAGLPNGLDLSTWKLVGNDDRGVRFELEVGNGLVLERSYSWQAGRRDLLLEFAVRCTKAIDGAPDHVTLFLDGVALAAPHSEWVLGQRPSLAVGSTVSTSAGSVQTFHHVADEKGLPKDAEAHTIAVELAQRPADGSIDFAGTANRFFGCFLYPADDAARAALLRAAVIRHVPGVPQHGAPQMSIPLVRYTIYLPMPAAQAESRVSFRMYLGPKSYPVFDENPEYERFDPVMKHTLDPACFCTPPGARAIATFLLWLLGILHGLVGNWGLAIVCLTILVRGSLVPVNFHMQKSMRAYGKRMSVLKPKIDEIQRKYKDDPKLLQQHMIAFQRENKIFPPLGGCLPMFLTIPVFIGLFTALRVSYELRQQPFFAWIDDLSRPDQLFELGWGFLPYFNILPVVMVGMWLLLQAGTPLPTDPQQRQMMKIMRFMPLIFGVTLYNYASGLMVYMITSSVFGIIEQRITRRVLGPMDANAAAIGATPML